jgi:cell division protein FtsL
MENEYDFPKEAVNAGKNEYKGGAEARRGAAPHTRRKPRRRAARPPMAVLCCVAVFVATFFIIGVISGHTVYIESESRSLSESVEKLRESNDLLQIEIDKLSSVERIEQAALDLGMVRPVNKMYIDDVLFTAPETASAPEEEGALQETAAPETAAVSGPVGGMLRLFTGFFAYARG